MQCFEMLLNHFRDYLEGEGFSVSVESDHSMRGWIRTLYLARRNDMTFKFLYESESSDSMGYSKILIII